MIDPDDVDLPDYSYEEIANRPKVVRDFQARCIRNRQATPEGVSPEEAIRIHVAYNLGLISHIDDQIGRLLSALENLALTEKTVILFTTDHGGFWGEHGLLEKSTHLHYRCLLQLPLIVSCPGLIPEGQTYDGMIEEVDFYPTLLDLANIENHRRINGRSFKQAVLDGSDPGRDEVFAEALWGNHPVASLRIAD
jgi:arylsulfatase A-like enzyme